MTLAHMCNIIAGYYLGCIARLFQHLPNIYCMPDWGPRKRRQQSALIRYCQLHHPKLSQVLLCLGLAQTTLPGHVGKEKWWMWKSLDQPRQDDPETAMKVRGLQKWGVIWKQLIWGSRRHKVSTSALWSGQCQVLQNTLKMEKAVC